jgi:AcrR family transcriptional regulator
MHGLSPMRRRKVAVSVPRAGSDPDATRQRILAAAEMVFSREGLRGATTREIAREAGVNEVTLFRHFRSRDLLLGAVMERGTLGTTDALRALPSWEVDLRTGMMAYARMLSGRFHQHEALCRAFVAEANLLADVVRRAIARMARFTRSHAAGQIRVAQKAGLVRADVDARLAADILTDALIAGALRRSGPVAGDYSAETLLQGTIEIFVRGIEPPVPARRPRKSGN